VLQTVQVWSDLARGLEDRPRPDLLAYREATQWARRWLGVAGAITLIGIATMVAGWFATSPRPAQTAPKG